MPILNIIVDATRDLPDKMGAMDKTDPYVILQIGGQTKQTTVKRNAGSDAVFNESLELNYHWEPELEVIVKDEDRLSRDDLVGSGKLPLTPLIRRRGFEGRIPIYTNSGSPNGHVCVRVKMRA
eukprot:Blabericola_migrator_1__11479@NODE_684_length_6884_cov_72_451372_g497_i0_p8_GENE_NODE_684_length_6884_cov_72_451372_g497_i0NODE_684_length_6884_cov_72_451372_g497_i0_p8_ORF_typecomplete_len123_score10_04C2/PF00168_30/1_7e15C2C2_1/PF11618_8/0_13B9C2/PF07162_11/0_15_NODE_684_length_6884_cov_72_451372_g497_i017482116